MSSRSQKEVWVIWLLMGLFFFDPLIASNQEKQNPEAPATIVNVSKIWDQAPHSAFTSLIRFQGRWFCAFREGSGHISPDGALRIITSSDGKHWESAALIRAEEVDLRDPHLSITPNGSLMLTAAMRDYVLSADGTLRYTNLQSNAWHSYDGFNWSDPHPIGDANFWLWRTIWHDGTAYSPAYSRSQPLRLYTSQDGKLFHFLENMMEVDDPALEGRRPSETKMIIGENGVAYALALGMGPRVPGRTSMIGKSKPPYHEWTWKNTGVSIGGPNMTFLPDGRIVAVIRIYEGRKRSLRLFWVNPDAGRLEEFLRLPSGGDNGYTGLVWHEDMLWISYYSSHEGKSNIYLAKVAFP